MFRLICKAVEEHEEETLGHIIDDRWKKVVVTLFQEARKHAMYSVHIPIYKVTEQAAATAFLTRGADKILDEKMYKLAKSQAFTQDLIRHFIKPSNFTVPANRFAQQQDKKVVASKAKFRQKNSGTDS